MSTRVFSERELEAVIDELAGAPVEVSDGVIGLCQETGEFGGLSFELLKEGTRLMYALSEYGAAAGRGSHLTLDQAICVGLMVRMSKMMLSILKLSSGQEHGETVAILCRCVFESSINLRYLLKRQDGTLYERFVKVGLKGERVLYDAIQSNISERGGSELGIEASMLASIERTCKWSGVDVADVNRRAGEWGGSLKNKMDELGIPDSAYVVQSMASQSVHGSCSDLILNHLSVEEGGYTVNTDHKATDGKHLGPVAMFALAAAREYLDRSLDPDESDPFRRRVDDLLLRLSRVEAARPGWETSGS